MIDEFTRHSSAAIISSKTSAAIASTGLHTLDRQKPYFQTMEVNLLVSRFLRYVSNLTTVLELHLQRVHGVTVDVNVITKHLPRSFSKLKMM